MDYAAPGRGQAGADAASRRAATLPDGAQKDARRLPRAAPYRARAGVTAPPRCVGPLLPPLPASAQAESQEAVLLLALNLSCKSPERASAELLPSIDRMCVRERRAAVPSTPARRPLRPQAGAASPLCARAYSASASASASAGAVSGGWCRLVALSRKYDDVEDLMDGDFKRLAKPACVSAASALAPCDASSRPLRAIAHAGGGALSSLPAACRAHSPRAGRSAAAARRPEDPAHGHQVPGDRGARTRGARALLRWWRGGERRAVGPRMAGAGVRAALRRVPRQRHAAAGGRAGALVPRCAPPARARTRGSGGEKAAPARARAGQLVQVVTERLRIQLQNPGTRQVCGTDVCSALKKAR